MGRKIILVTKAHTVTLLAVSVVAGIRVRAVTKKEVFALPGRT